VVPLIGDVPADGDDPFMVPAAPDRADGAADAFRASALQTVDCEIAALRDLRRDLEGEALGQAFARAAALIQGTTGRVVATGMGKSGLIARKLAATLASTGTPALFLHPADASHGDMGMIAPGDVVLALSWSGETSELSNIINYCHRRGVPLIALTAGAASDLAKRASVVLAVPAVREACPNQLAPTSSTIVQAALGDALAVALVEARGFSSSDFHVYHPAGRLGAKLLQVGDLMSRGDDVPRVGADATIMAAMVEMSQKRFGVTAIVGDGDRLLGAFTDGDLRRSLANTSVHAPVQQFMTPNPLVIEADRLASHALALMNGRSVLQLFVCRGPALIGIIHLHDVLRAGVA
jgi:arabinose-5-phosphate isomerase